MTKDLLKLRKELKSFAKRVKNFKYTETMLITFLMTGLVSIEQNLFSKQIINNSINNQTKKIDNSIKEIQQNIKLAKYENDKLSRKENLELIQLMEQGEYVVKSPWNSWQYGTGFSFNKWNGTYKGYGDKKRKYSYNGVFERETNEFNRYVSPESALYQYLPLSKNTKSALTNERNGLTLEYGLAKTKNIKEPIITVELAAAIRPKTINKQPLNLQPKEVNTPEFPQVVRFSAINPNINIPNNPSLPAAPAYQLFLGPDSNVATSPIVGGTTFVNQLTETNFLANDTRSMQNVRSQLRYTLDSYYTAGLGFPTSLITVAFKMWMDDGGVFGMYDITSDTNGYTKRNNWYGGSPNDQNNYISPFNSLPNDIYFNSYNFSHNGGTNEYRTAVGDSTVGGNPQNYNNQRFFVGGSRFLEIDNKGRNYIEGCRVNCDRPATVTLPADKTLNLSGPLTLGMVSQENGVIFKNDGKITDEKENQEQFAIDTPDNLVLNVPSPTPATGTLTIKKSSEGYLGYKVGIAQVAENSTQNNTSQQNGGSFVQPIYNNGTIDFKGPNSIGMYVYLYRTNGAIQAQNGRVTNIPSGTPGNPIGTFAQLHNNGTISLSGKNSYGMKVASFSSSQAMMLNETDGRILLTKNGNDKADNSVGMAIMKDDTIFDAAGATFPLNRAGNNGTVTLDGVADSVGLYVNIASNIINGKTGTINIDSEIEKVISGNQVVNIGMRSDQDATTPAASTAKIDNRGIIKLNGAYGIGMLTNGSKLVNSGSIITKTNGDEKHGIGIVGINEAEIENRGIIRIKGSGDTENIGVYLNKSEGVTGTIPSDVTPIVEVTGNKSTGILATNYSNLEMAGNVTVSGDNITGIIANDNSEITLTGNGIVTVDNNGDVSSPIDGKGTYGIIVKDANSKFTGANTAVNVKITSDKSMGLYSKGELTVGSANITATDGAINFLASEGGDIKVSGGYNVTGQKSLLFYTSDNGTNKGTITFGGATSATVKGGTTPNTRGTVFYHAATGSTYSLFDTSGIKNYFDNTFGTGTPGSSTLNHLTLNMQEGSRLFIGSNIETNLTVADSLNSLTAGSIGTNVPTINVPSNRNFKTFMLHLSKLNIDQNVNLDNPVDAFNQIEIANSSMENTHTMIGTQIKQVGMAQENMDSNPASKITLENKNGAKILLSGNQSTGIYAKRGLIKNGGEINVLKDSTGIYLVEDNNGTGIQGSSVTNDTTGLIKLGENSTGIYYKAESTGINQTSNGGVTNNGKIESTTNNVTAMTFENPITGTSRIFGNRLTGVIDLQGDKSTGIYATGAGTYSIANDGIIKSGNSSDANNPNIGMFTDKTGITLNNNGTVEGGNKVAGLYGYNINLGTNSVTKVGNGGTAVYSKGGNINIAGGSSITTGSDNGVAVYYAGDGGTITNNANTINIGDNSFGFVIKNDTLTTGNALHSNTSNVNVGNRAVYIYSNDKLGNINNNTNLVSSGNENYAIYSDGIVTNTGNIDFSTGIGNVGIYSTNGGTATNNGTISVGMSDIEPENLDDRRYSIGMAGGYRNLDTGNIINNGTINVNGADSIGMYATGEGSIARNNVGAKINLGADGAIGMYLDEKAKGYNDGIIQTTPGLKPKVAVGVVVRKGAILYNTGTIHIVSPRGIAIFDAKGGIIHNTGTIILGEAGNAENGERENGIPGIATTKEAGTIKINAPKGAAEAVITVNGIPVTPETVNITVGERDMLTSTLGMYIDTLRKTNPIVGLASVTDSADLIIGVEATKVSNSKYIKVSDEILKPYNDTINRNEITTWNIYSGSLTWMATATLGGSAGYINNLYLAKRNYTELAKNKSTYNFLDGLEQRYGIESLDSREKQLFLKLNGIGKNEQILFYQATDEMMGHQYGNLQQRINATGNILDNEFNYLHKEWRSASKQNNKIRVFGVKDKYKSNTAGVINYTSNAYGVAYIHDNETPKMGNNSGWYAGAVANNFKFKDIGHSKENQTMIKAGVFKTMSPKFDHNGSFQWTVAGDIFTGINNMKRKYLVVDDIFEAKSTYNSYGAAIKNELSYDIRMSERMHLKPFGNLKIEYGKFENIKENDGEIKLQIKENDYVSVKPEFGMEFKYIQPLATKTNLSIGLTAVYENELGKIGNVNNKGKVKDTEAGWFNIRGEKENRGGNGKFDLKVGVDNTRFGVTANFGYETKGKNVKGGIGLRAIF